jgi:hypothetical protein
MTQEKREPEELLEVIGEPSIPLEPEARPGRLPMLLGFGLTLGSMAFIVILGIAILLIFLRLPQMAEKVFPWIMIAVRITLAVCLLLFLPLAVAKRTRFAAGVGFRISSYVFGLSLWIYSVTVAFRIWGWWGLIVGLILLGVGVVPIAYLATVLNGYWPIVGDLVLATVLTFGSRFLGRLCERA